MKDFLIILVELFSSREVRFSKSDDAAARALQALQSTLYSSLIAAMQEVPFNDGPRRGSAGLGDMANLVIQSARQKSTEPPKIEEVGDEIVVRGALPILLDDPVQRAIAFISMRNLAETGLRSSAEAVRMGDLFAGALIAASEPRQIGVPPPQNVNGQDFLSVTTQAARFLAAQEILLRNPANEERHAAALAAIQGQIENYKAEFEGERANQRGALDVLQASAIDVDEKVRATEGEIEAARKRLHDFENTIREELRLDRARLTWGTRFKEAQTSFRATCVVLALYLIVTIFVAVAFGSSIVAAINKFDFNAFLTGGSVGTTVAHHLGRLLVFSVPVIVYLWTLKVVVRFFMRSMLLMDDARQRETMLNTYFLLSEKGRADERDRPLILWALFRQTPGHGPDGIEPPDFTEVINAGMKRAASNNN